MKITLLCLFLQTCTFLFVTNNKALNHGVPTAKTLPATVVDFSGEGSYEVFPGSTWQFFGPVRTIAVAEGQKIVATGTAVLGAKSATTRAAIAVCYQASPTAPVNPMIGDNHLNVEVDAVQRQYTASGTLSPPPGNYVVGYCLVNSGREVIGRNNYVNGWAMAVE